MIIFLFGSHLSVSRRWRYKTNWFLEYCTVKTAIFMKVHCKSLSGLLAHSYQEYCVPFYYQLTHLNSRKRFLDFNKTEYKTPFFLRPP